ncbi:MAG: WXG100 family type VII secretion target [Lachnospiraceae bacterium]|nr:WXG100 family type VII secretion target [Lachnospiraceae bacterium]
MEGILKVTPEKLMASSEQFGATAKQMRAHTDEMMALINSLKGIWIGEAQDAYNAKFNMLQTDMDKLYRMVTEHSSDLMQMAATYAEAENTNTTTGQSLGGNVIV